MNGHYLKLARARKYDFNFKFFISSTYPYKQYADIIAQASLSHGGLANPGLDFTDWTVPAWLSDAQWCFQDRTADFVALGIDFASTDAMASWSIELTGHGYNEVRHMRRSCMVALVQAWYEDGGVITTTPWGLGFIGVISEVSPAFSPRINGEFKMRVDGLSHFLSVLRMSPRSYGKRNIAQGSPITFSSTLLDPTPLYNRGEFVGTQVVLGASNATDGVLWGPPACSAEPPYPENFLRILPGDPLIWEIYLWPPTGYSDQYQWLSVGARASGIHKRGYGNYILTLGDDLGHTPYAIPFPWLRLPGNDDVDSGDVGIVCYSQKRVEELFDIGSASWVYEWRTKYPDVRFDTARDFACVDAWHDATDYVPWGTTPSIKDTPPLEIRTGAGPAAPSFTWTGDGVNTTGMQPGRSLSRRYYDTPNARWVIGTDTNAAADFMSNDYPAPLAGARTGVDPQWCVLSLGQLNCPLSVNFDPAGTYPKTMTVNSTYGLSAVGQAIVAGQRFAYDSLTGTTINVTAWYGTASIVGSGNFVYQYDVQAATTRYGYKVSTVRISRKPGLSHIKIGEIHASYLNGTLMEPDAPEEDHWQLDWGALGSPENGLSFYPGPDAVTTGVYDIAIPYDQDNPEKNRFTQLIIIAFDMRGNSHLRAATDPLYVQDGGYFLVNEIEVFASQTTAGTTIIEPPVVGEILDRLLIDEVGVPSNNLDIARDIAEVYFDAQSTSQSSYANVLNDMLGNYGLVMTESLDGTLHIHGDPWRNSTTGTIPQIGTLTEADIASITEQYSKLDTIAQAKIQARDASGRTSYVGVYPAIPNKYGEITSGDSRLYVATSQKNADDIAGGVYRKTNKSSSFTVEIAGFMPCLTPFQLINIDVSQGAALADDVRDISGLFVIENVRHKIDLGSPLAKGRPSSKNWTTTFTARSLRMIHRMV